MRKNLLVLVAPNANCDKDEKELIAIFNPPLNLINNHNIINQSYRKLLKKLRERPVEE